MLALKTSLSKSYENAPGWAGASPTVVRHTGANTAAAIQLVTRIRNWVKHDVSPRNNSFLGQAILALPLFVDLMDEINSGQVLPYATEGFISCHARVKLDNVLQRGAPSWLIWESSSSLLADLKQLHRVPRVWQRPRYRDKGSHQFTAQQKPSNWVTKSGTSQTACSPKTEDVLLRSCTPSHKHQSVHAKTGSATGLLSVTWVFDTMAVHECGSLGSCVQGFWWTEWQ